jgi:flagellar biosynthesis/type III secretory pathway chaperone
VNSADQLATLLADEEVALRDGDAQALLSLAQHKEVLLKALQSDPPAKEVLLELLQTNRRNGLLARSGLSLLNQVLGATSGSGIVKARPSGQFLCETV